MKKFVIAGTLVTALSAGTAALAQSTPAKQPPPPPAPKAVAGAEKPAGQAAEKPVVTKKKASSSSGDTSAAAHTAPKTQPGTTDEPTAPGAMALGSVHIPKGLKANGQDLPAGTYQVRLTADEAKPDAKGSTEKLERWVEFVQAGKVVGREVVSIVPATETKLVQKDTPPPSGGAKVEALKGGDYTRLWINRAGTYYLVHLTKG
jgi:hypothetical protein